MPTTFFEWDGLDGQTQDDEIAVVDEKALIRPLLDANGFGNITTVDAIITSRTHNASAMEDLFSLEVEEITPSDSSIVYRMSNDDGATYLYWDGAAWSLAGATDFNTLIDINANIETFPFSADKSVKFQVKLIGSTDETVSPKVGPLCLGVHYDFHNFFEDVLRTLHNTCSQRANTNMRFDIPALDQDRTSIPLNYRFTITEVLAVYDLTNDPGRTTNLFSSVTNNVVALTDTIPSGARVEISTRSTIPCFLRRKPEFKSADLPFLLIELDESNDENMADAGEPDVIKNLQTSKARLYEPPLYERMSATFRAVAASQIQSLAIIDGVQRSLMPGPPDLDKFGQLRLLGNGEKLEILAVEPYTFPIRADRGQSESAVVIDFVGKRWSEQFEEVPLHIETELFVKVGQIGEAA